MPTTATRKRRWPLWLLAVFAFLVFLYAIVGFLFLPWWLEQQLPRQAERHLGWQVDAAGIDTNPFILSATLDDLTATDAGGEPVANVESLHLNLSFLQFFLGRVEIDALHIRQPYLRLEISESGRLNVLEDWRNHSPLANASTQEAGGGSDTQDGGGGLPLIIDTASLERGKILLRDHRTSEVREFSITPLQFSLDGVAIYTDPGEAGHYELIATLGDNQNLRWEGNIELMPFRSSGRIELENIQADSLWHFIGRYVTYDWREGRIDLQTDYRIDTASTLQFALDNGQLELRDSELYLDPDREGEPALRVARLDAQGVRFDWPRSRLEAGDVAITDWTLVLSRDEASNIDWGGGTDDAGDEEEAGNESDNGNPFTWKVQHLGLAQGSLNWRDDSLTDTAELTLRGIEADLTGLTGDPDQPVGIALQLNDGQGGQGRLDGEFTVVPFTLEASLQLADVPLVQFQPYLSASTALALESGTLGFDGIISLDDQQPGLTGSLDGNLVVDGLATRLPALDASFLAWDSLRLEALEVSLKPLAVDIRTLTLQGPELTYVRLEGDNSFARLTTDEDEPGPASRNETGGQAESEVENNPALRISQASLENGVVVIEDRAIEGGFRSRIHQIGGDIVGISNRKPQRGQVSLQGLVAEQGSLRVDGEIGALGQTDTSTLEITGENLALVPLSPYFARYLGYTVDDGRLELDLDYTLEGDQLAGTSEFTLYDFSLGEKVQSDAAIDIDVPVGLGISLLRGPGGAIDLDIPVSGNLSDPQFSFSDVVLEAFANLVGRAATAPFSILGRLANLVDFSGEELGEVAFLPGTDRLAPKEPEKLEALAKALRERSGITLNYWGATAPEWDRPALVLASEGYTLPAADLESQIRSLEQRLVAEEGEDALDRLLEQYAGTPEERFDSAAWAQSLLHRLADGRTPEPGALRDLAEDRASALREALLQQGGIDPDQLSALATRNDADVDKGRVVIEFDIDSR